MVLTAKGVTRPGAPLPRQLNYESKLLFHLRAADLLLGHDPAEAVARAITGEDPAAFTRASAGGYTRDALGFLTQWGQGIPRIKMFDLDGDGYWEEPGILLEGPRTNAFTKSIELDDAVWTKTRATASANAIEAPDGTATADKLVEDGTASESHFFIRLTPALTNDTQQSFSLFAKAAGRSEILVRMGQKDGTNADVWFDLSAGTVGTATGGAVGLIEKYADGWYRCMLMYDSASGGSTPQVLVFMGSGSETISYSGDSASGVYVWGQQFEVDAAFPSSFILTTGGTVARSADALTYTLAFLGLTMDDLTDDFTTYVRMARPFYADAVGDIGTTPGLFELSTAPDRLYEFFGQSVRDTTSVIDTGVDKTTTVSYPAGDPVELLSQFKALAAAGQVAIDVGSGLSAFSGAAVGFTTFGNTTVGIGIAGLPLAGALFELKVGRGLRTLKQMQESF